MKYSYEMFNYKFDRKYPKIFDVSNKLLELNNDLIDYISYKKYKTDEMSRYQIIIMFNYYKSTNSLLSLLNLSRLGLIGDAKSICRKLIEISITLKYISVDWKDRQNLYWDYIVKHASKDLHKVGSNDKEILMIVKDIESRLEKDLAKLKNDWSSRKKENTELNFNRNWSGLELFDMAKSVDMEFEFTKPHYVYNSSVHSGIDDIRNYFDFDNYLFDATLEQKDIQIVLFEALKSYIIISKIIIEGFNIENQLKELESIATGLRTYELQVYNN